MSSCGICLEKKPNLVSIGCSHKYCSECLTEYIEVAFVKQKKSFLLTKCPQPKCDQLISYDQFKQFATKKVMDLHNVVVQTIPTSVPKSLDDFNYYYNSKGQLRCKINGTH
jgi:hypothetical protein